MNQNTELHSLHINAVRPVMKGSAVFQSQRKKTLPLRCCHIWALPHSGSRKSSVSMNRECLKAFMLFGMGEEPDY